MFAHAPGFDVNDPSYAMLMHGSEQYVNNPYYPWQNMQGGIKGMPVHPSAYQGMSATLAPAVLDNHVDSTLKHPSTTASTPVTTHKKAPADSLPSAGLDFHFSQESKEPSFFSMGHGITSGSGHVTPAGEGFWDNFVWDDSANDAQAAESVSGSVGVGGEV